MAWPLVEELFFLPREAAKKSYFLNGQTIKALHPPPPLGPLRDEFFLGGFPNYMSIYIFQMFTPNYSQFMINCRYSVTTKKR